MKKIAIVTRRMIAGGIEKALISMLEMIPKDKFDITLFVMSRGGEFEKYIPKNIKVKCLYGEEKSTKDKIVNNFKKGNILQVIRIPIYTTLAIKSKRVYKQEEYLAKIIPKQKEKFDLAIAYHTPASFPVVYVSKYLNARKKIAWIHSDVEVYKNELERYISYYNTFDKIYCVSKYGKVKFDNQYPHLKNKTDIFYNIINKDEIIRLSDEKSGFNDNFNGIRILTVARLTKEKGCDIVPEILDSLIKEGLDIKWYLVGDGEERDYLNKRIVEMGLENKLVLLGVKNNPYPYFKNCDIYVQPSRHEGYCITLAEAKLFNKPIITTDFVGAIEQIEDNNTGLIVKFNIDELKDSIKKLIKDNRLREKLIFNLSNLESKNNKGLESLYNLIEESEVNI